VVRGDGMTGTYRYQDLNHPEPGSPFSGLGAPVPTCPGCGVAVIMFDDDIHTCQPGAASARATVTDGVPVSMCPDCYCSIANGLDSIDVTDERRDEIAAGLVSAGPHAVVDTDDEGSFSMWPCDVCATRLGGHRVGGWIYPVTA